MLCISSAVRSHNDVTSRPGTTTVPADFDRHCTVVTWPVTSYSRYWLDVTADVWQYIDRCHLNNVNDDTVSGGQSTLPHNIPQSTPSTALPYIANITTLWRPLLPYGYSWLWSILYQTGLSRSFVIFDIRTLWRSGLSVRVPGCQKLQMTGLTRSDRGCFIAVLYGNNGLHHRLCFFLPSRRWHYIRHGNGLCNKLHVGSSAIAQLSLLVLIDRKLS